MSYISKLETQASGVIFTEKSMLTKTQLEQFIKKDHKVQRKSTLTI